MIKFQENTQTDVRREGRTDHISQDPSSYRQGLTSTTAVDWHLKAKNYCITVSMQKISSIHKLIQQILGSHELNDHVHFLPSPPKHHWNFIFISLAISSGKFSTEKWWNFKKNPSLFHDEIFPVKVPVWFSTQIPRET